MGSECGTSECYKPLTLAATEKERLKDLSTLFARSSPQLLFAIFMPPTPSYSSTSAATVVASLLLPLLAPSCCHCAHALLCPPPPSHFDPRPHWLCRHFKDHQWAKEKQTAIKLRMEACPHGERWQLRRLHTTFQILADTCLALANTQV